MSRESIARALGEVMFTGNLGGDDPKIHPSVVDRLLGSGTVFDAEELLRHDQIEKWRAMSAVLPRSGWRPVVVFVADEVTPAWAPPNTTKHDIDTAKSPHLTIGTGLHASGSIIWWPAFKGLDEDGDPTYFSSVEDLFTWLETP